MRFFEIFSANHHPAEGPSPFLAISALSQTEISNEKSRKKVQGADDYKEPYKISQYSHGAFYLPAGGASSASNPADPMRNRRGYPANVLSPPGDNYWGRKGGLKENFFARKNSSEKIISKNFTILRVNL